MQKFSGLLLDVWREACRHIDICESVGRLGAILEKRLPVRTLLVRSIDLREASVHTVAAEILGADPAPPPTRSPLEPAAVETLLRWCRENDVLRRDARDIDAGFPGCLPPDVNGHVLVGPLNGESEAFGLLVFVAAPSKRFTVDHQMMFKALLDPFAVALRNSQQLHELEKLREAVEADNRSLLSRLDRQNIADSVVGTQTGLREVMERVELVSRSSAPVLILGETGSGKEVAARAVHDRSPRSSGPFLRVNCGAIPPDLIDSELFGHERGSFTGAVEQRKGWFERADGGTLFLDEVAELPPAAQVRLLRILQDGSFERVGGQKTMHVDVRLITATHRDLKTMVADGTFREDVWYRIAVFPIAIPPLRERREDIPALAAHFALRAARRLGAPALIPSPDDNARLIAYDWPGNVRELAAVIERATILGGARRLEIAKAIGADLSIAMPEARAATIPVPAGPPPDEVVSLDDAMKRHIEATLRMTRGRVDGPDGAARRLRINPNTLRGRMRKLGVEWKQYR